ncbi:Terminal uridylyltransferase 4 [Gryganskiella cystojenkinii]|nr:Terminal uridylyltransferase 4 [Gryganskiella cystojenkinii]
MHGNTIAITFASLTVMFDVILQLYSLRVMKFPSVAHCIRDQGLYDEPKNVRKFVLNLKPELMPFLQPEFHQHDDDGDEQRVQGYILLNRGVRVPLCTAGDMEKFLSNYSRKVSPKYLDEVPVIIYFLRTELWHDTGSGGKSTLVHIGDGEEKEGEEEKKAEVEEVDKESDGENTTNGLRGVLEFSRRGNAKRLARDESRNEQGSDRCKDEGKDDNKGKKERHDPDQEAKTTDDEDQYEGEEFGKERDPSDDNETADEKAARVEQERIRQEWDSTNLLDWRISQYMKRKRLSTSEARWESLSGLFLSGKEIEVDFNVSDPKKSIVSIDAMASAISAEDSIAMSLPWVPAVRFYDPDTLTRCEISLNQPSELRSILLNTYSLIDPNNRFMILWASLRMIASRHEILGNSDSDGLTPYALALMMTTFLQTRVPPVLPVLQGLRAKRMEEVWTDDGWDASFDRNYRHYRTFSRNTESCASLLKGFTYFFGQQFQFKDWQIVPSESFIAQDRVVPFAKDREARQALVDAPICVLDPFERNRNVARNCSQKMVNKIRDVMLLVYTALCDDDLDTAFKR